MSAHNLCFRAKIEKNVYLCKLEFYHVKWAIRGCTLHGLVFMMNIILIKS